LVRQVDADFDRRRAEVRLVLRLHRDKGEADTAGMQRERNDSGQAPKRQR
jgi:hypothetical protein